MKPTYTDIRSQFIEANLGRPAAMWADRNAADWVLDLLADSTINGRGPQAGTRVCDQAATKLVPAGLVASYTVHPLAALGQLFGGGR